MNKATIVIIGIIILIIGIALSYGAGFSLGYGG